MQEVAALQGLRDQNGAALADAGLSDIQSTPKMLEFAMAAGRSAFGDNCAPCHGSGGGGATGYPNLNDDDWLWGGTLEDIHQTLLYGVRSGHDDTRFGDMPAYGRDGLLSSEEIRAAANHVRSLSGLETEANADLAQGETVFLDNCSACHGEDGKGMRDQGAPNLTDGIWLYGRDNDSIVETITNARYGIMPAFQGRLTDAEIRKVAVYVHTLGGGE
jgi:cytochrome c oxidase cbb3-type subunit 3